MESFLAAQENDWEVHGLPAFQDNYLWLIVHRPSQKAIAIDPGCGQTVDLFLSQHHLHLEGVAITHPHPDHVGGLPLLLQKQPQLAVWAPPRVGQATIHPKENDVLEGINLSFHVLEVPGHTLDHLAYVVSVDQACWLFCGDTLFSGGCGRLFEGTATQLFESFAKFKKLPPHTLVFCAHEYTESNLKFAQVQLPEDSAIEFALHETKATRQLGRSTVPSSLKREELMNIFYRSTSIDELAKWRKLKDMA